MDQFKKIERKIELFLRPFPPMPRFVRRWIAQNTWWLAAVSLGATILSSCFLIRDVVLYSSSLNTISGLASYVDHRYSSAGLATLQFDLVVSVFMIIILSTAIRPLKALRYRGWSLLYLLLLLNAIRVVVDAVLTFSIGHFILDIISGGIGLIISAYILFQIRDQYQVTVKRTTRRATIIRK